MRPKCALHIKKTSRTMFNLSFFWWRCGESDPGPNSHIRHFLHVYRMIDCFALRFIRKPPIDDLVITTTLPRNRVALSVFITPIGKGTENLASMCH